MYVDLVFDLMTLKQLAIIKQMYKGSKVLTALKNVGIIANLELATNNHRTHFTDEEGIAHRLAILIVNNSVRQDTSWAVVFITLRRGFKNGALFHPGETGIVDRCHRRGGNLAPTSHFQ